MSDFYDKKLIQLDLGTEEVLDLVVDEGEDYLFEFIKTLVERQEDISFDERVFVYFAKKVIELKKGFIDGSLNPNGDDDLLDETYDIVNQLSDVFQKSNK